MKATTAEDRQETAAAQADARATTPRVGDPRSQLMMRRPLAGAIAPTSPLSPGRGADDRSGRPARAVVAHAPTEARFAVAAEPEPAVARSRGEIRVREPKRGVLAYEGPTRAATRAARRELRAEALALIRREYGTDLRLADVARRIGASTRALQRAFEDHGDLSFSEELRATRLNAAERLLRRTDLPIGVIARRVGYHGHAPFTKAYRRYHGTSPRAHRAG